MNLDDNDLQLLTHNTSVFQKAPVLIEAEKYRP